MTRAIVQTRPAPYRWFAGGSLLALLIAQAAGGAVATASVLVLAVALFPVVRSLARGTFDPFEAVYGFFAYNLFTILFRGWADLAMGGPILLPRYGLASPMFTHTMTLVFLATALFLACFLVGYESAWGPWVAARVPRLRAAPATRFSLGATLLVATAVSIPAAAILRHRLGGAIAEGGYFAASREGGISGISYLLRFALAGAYLTLAHLAGRREKAPFLLSAAYALSLSLVVFVLVPTKILVANTLLVTIGVVHYLRHRVRMRTLVGVAFAGLFLIPVLTAYRRGLGPAQIFEVVKSLPSNPQLLFAGLFQRSFGADSIFTIIAGTSHGMPFEHGRTFTGLGWWWVPRSIWPEKPVTSAITFWADYLRQSNYFPPYVSASPTMVGELYLNFWWPGLIGGGLVIGATYRAVYSYFQRHRAHPAVTVLYLLALAVLIKAAEGPITDHMQELFVNCGTCVLVLVCLEVLVRLVRGGRLPHPLPEAAG